MEEIKIGSHVRMAGKEMFFSVRKGGRKLRSKCVDALYGCTTEYPQKKKSKI